jgi:hypothetical protein
VRVRRYVCTGDGVAVRVRRARAPRLSSATRRLRPWILWLQELSHGWSRARVGGQGDDAVQCVELS